MKSTQPLAAAASGWIFLVPRFAVTSAYQRVKIWRQLKALGAVVLRNSVYALPRSRGAETMLRKLVRQIEDNGGDALLCEGNLVAGLSDEEVKRLFNAARDSEYAELATDLRNLVQADKRKKARDPDLNRKLLKARQAFASIGEIDFFDAGGKSTVEGLLARLEHSPIEKQTGKPVSSVPSLSAVVGRTWVTRQGIHVDRIACAWLIRRFIDPKARFKFVPGRKYRPQSKELRFDMADGEFTHEGDKCSFEVLVERLGRRDGALTCIAQIIHDLDLRDGKFDRPEASGVGQVIDGICLTEVDDFARVTRGAAFFDATYKRLRRG